MLFTLKLFFHLFRINELILIYIRFESEFNRRYEEGHTTS